MNAPKRHLLVTILTGALTLAACSSETGEQVAGPGELGHIHDLVINDDGDLLVASHSGLYRIESIEMDEAVIRLGARWSPDQPGSQWRNRRPPVTNNSARCADLVRQVTTRSRFR